jgi:hypothetical protein
MLDLGIDELKEKIIKEEKIIEKIYGPGSKHRDVIVAVLLMCLAIKMYLQKDLKGILHHLHINKTPLRRAVILVAFLLVLFKDDEHINLSVQHAFFAIIFHLLTYSENIVNLFWFTLISAYYFNTSDVGE